MEAWKENYITRNAPVCVFNAICHFLWEGRTFQKSVQDCIDHVSKFNYCNANEFSAEMYKILDSIKTESGMKKFLKQIMETYPGKRTTKEFIKREFCCEDLTLSKLCAIVQGF